MVACTALSILACFAPAGAAAKHRDRIAFSDDSGIYTVNPDGRHRVRLTHNGLRNYDTHPVWSRSGARIAFLRMPLNNGTDHIWVMGARGRHKERLPIPARLVPEDMAWGPAGGRLAFTAILPSGAQDVFMYTFATRKTVALHAGHEPERYPGQIDWSPDGKLLIFSAEEAIKDQFGDLNEGDYDLYTMRPDGTDLVTLTDTDHVEEYSPQYSLSGTRLLYIRTRGECQQLVVSRVDATAPATLPVGCSVYAANWASGGRVLFMRSDPVHDSIAVLARADGTHRKRLLPGAATAVWRPPARLRR